MIWQMHWIRSRVDHERLLELEGENVRMHRDLLKFEERMLRLEMRCTEQDRLTLALSQLLVDSGVLTREAVDEILVPRDDAAVGG